MNKSREESGWERKVELSQVQSALGDVELKLRGLAHLFFNQGDEPAAPRNPIDINQGIGMILESLADDLLNAWKLHGEVPEVSARLRKKVGKRNRRSTPQKVKTKSG